MNIFQTQLLDQDMIFVRMGEVDPFESFSEYAVRELLPVFGTDESLRTTYCLVSGFPVAVLNSDEVAALIQSAVVALELDGMGSGPEKPSDSDVGMAFEMILDHIATRIIETSRPAPSLTFSRNRLAIANAHWTRQMAVLVSTLLFDAGQLREKSMGYTDKVERIQATIEMAKYIHGLESSAIVDELFSVLIELDAKYDIRNLKFIRREAEALEALRDVGVPTFESIHKFAIELLARRDNNETEIEDGQLWTREVYAQRTFAAVDREAHSNLFKRDTSDPKRYTPEAREAAKRGRKPSADVAARKATESAKKDVKNKTAAFDAAFDQIFGGK